jgi:hypothetical protein
MFLRTPWSVTPEPTREGEGAGGGDPAPAPAPVDPAPAPAPAPVAASTLWDQIPEELRVKPDLERYKDPTSKIGDVFNDLVATKSMLGKMGQGTWAQLPVDGDAEGRRALLTQMGVAEDFATYAEAAKIDPKSLPEGAEIDEAFDKEFLALAHATGIHPSEVNKFREFVATKAKENQEVLLAANQERIASEIKALEAAWGPAKGKNYAANRAAANEAADRLNYLALGLDPDKDDLPEGQPTIARLLADAGLATNPLILRALAQMNTVFTGTSTVPISKGGSGAETPDQLDAKADAISAESLKFINADNEKMRRMQAEAFQLRERADNIRKGG